MIKLYLKISLDNSDIYYLYLNEYFANNPSKTSTISVLSKLYVILIIKKKKVFEIKPIFF